MKLVLGSGSPRRAEALRTLGLGFEVVAPDVDEIRLPDEDPHTYVERLAREKAAAVVGRGVIAIGGDTVVVHGGRVLGKPGHPEEARSMLRRLQSDKHEVLTGMAVAAVSDTVRIHTLVDMAEVWFLPMTEEEISDYVGTGEPLDKAGAYAIQGRAARYIEGINGSPYTVMGLPVHLLDRLMGKHGHHLHEFVADR